MQESQQYTDTTIIDLQASPLPRYSTNGSSNAGRSSATTSKSRQGAEEQTLTKCRICWRRSMKEGTRPDPEIRRRRGGLTGCDVGPSNASSVDYCNHHQLWGSIVVFWTLWLSYNVISCGDQLWYFGYYMSVKNIVSFLYIRIYHTDPNTVRVIWLFFFLYLRQIFFIRSFHGVCTTCFFPFVLRYEKHSLCFVGEQSTNTS